MLRNLIAIFAVTSFGLLVAGCGAGGNSGHNGQDAPAGQSSHADDHPTEGPHGGHLIELGEEEYHAELIEDEATHTVTIYLLNSSGKQPVEGDEPEITLNLFRNGEFVSYTLTAAEGKSVFSLTDAELCDLLLHAEDLKGRLNVAIAGKDYVGIIDHEAHDHAGQDHGGHEATGGGGNDD